MSEADEFRKMAEQALSEGNWEKDIRSVVTALRNTHNKAVEECAKLSIDFAFMADANKKANQGIHIADAIRRLRKE